MAKTANRRHKTKPYANRTKMTCISVAVASCAVMCLIATSCSDNANTGKRRQAMADSLTMIDDSLAVNSTDVEQMIETGMRNASDSLDYYDFYLRKLRHDTSLNLNDSTEADWQSAYNFLSRLKYTPRTKGMMGQLKNTRANFLHKLHGDRKQAIRLYRSAYNDLMVSDSKHALPDVCANLGDAYVFDNDMPRAAQWYRRALFLADSLRLPKKANLSLQMGLGQIYVKLGDYKAAAECYAKTDSNLKAMPLNMQLYFLNNYGNYYYYKKDYRNALLTFERLEKLLKDNGLEGSYEMPLCQINMADIYLNLGITDKARLLEKKAETYFTKIKDTTAIYYAHTVRMGLALQEGDTAEVKSIINSENIEESNIDFQLTNIRRRYLRKYYERTGNYRKAYNILRASVISNDSMKHNTEMLRTSDIIMRYRQDTLQLHHHIAMQKKDADILKARWGQFIGVLVAILSIILTLLGFTLQRKRKLQMQMQLMNLKLTNVRNRISPHFIFNVLNNRITKTDKSDADELHELTKLIRANLNISSRYLVSLKEELDFVKYYISVEQQCIEGGLDFIIDTPPDNTLEQIMIPSMFIQILVENSIKHGLKGRKEDKTISVNVTTDTMNCYIYVADNGRGFDIRNTDSNSTGTGLKVIRSTINMLNLNRKHKIKMNISNNKDKDGNVTGCLTNLIIPLDLSQNEHKY